MDGTLYFLLLLFTGLGYYDPYAAIVAMCIGVACAYRWLFSGESHEEKP